MAKGMEMLLQQFGLTPDKIQAMAEPVVTAILGRVQQFDDAQAQRHSEVMARFDTLEQLIREETGATQPAGVGAATIPDDATLQEIESTHDSGIIT